MCHINSKITSRIDKLLAKQNSIKLALKAKVMPFFEHHDTNSELINYIETIF